MIRIIPSSFWWGKRVGTYSAYQEKSGYIRGWIIKGRRGGLGRGTFKHKQPNENKGGVGRRAKKARKYANRKLWRKYGSY